MSARDFARKLRKEATPEEAALWQLLRNRMLAGHKFRRQHPITVPRAGDKPVVYFADFCCHASRLIVELDGAGHAFQAEYDAVRDGELEALGFRVVRIDNAEIAQPERVLARIAALL